MFVLILFDSAQHSYNVIASATATNVN